MSQQTLESLIEACADGGHQRLRWIKNHKSVWLAQARPRFSGTPDIKARGRSLREALENLVTALKEEANN